MWHRQWLCSKNLNGRQRCLSSNWANSNQCFPLPMEDLLVSRLPVGETCQLDQNRCREAQPMEVLTITAPETFNFQAVVAVSMGWHVLAVWNTEPVSVWLSTFMLQRLATTLDRWLLNDFWFDSMVLGWAGVLFTRTTQQERLPVTCHPQHVFHQAVRRNIYKWRLTVASWQVWSNLVIFYCAEIGLTCRICS